MKEIKVAVAMNGGVSLAVWIGGVTTEIYRCHEHHGIYGKLQDALGCKVRVDVITGASAGGLNGVLLGTALAQGLPVEVFERLKQTWLQVGDFAALLRDPLNRNPPSLMKGNEVFLPEIERLVLSWLSAGVSDTRKTDDLDIYLTTTPLEPGALTYLDTLGTVLREPVTRASFRFNVDNFTVDQDGRGVLAKQLAVAARASASFPAAFEPVYVNARSNGGSTTMTAAPASTEVDMTGIASISSPKWVMDGGVLVNKPVGPAIKLIQGKPNKTNGRRVLLYVVPDPGTGPADLPAELDSPPTIASVVAKSLFTLPRAESIAADLQSMREHNRAVRRQRDVRRELLTDDDLRAAVGADEDGLWPLAKSLYPMWKLWRDHRAADERIDEFLERADGDRNLPVKGQKYTWQQVIAALTKIRRDSGFLPRSVEPASVESVPTWTYGHQALDAACGTLQDLARQVLELKPPGEVPKGLDWIATDLATHRGTLQLIDDLNSSYWQDSLGNGAADEEDSPTAFAQRLFGSWPIAPETRAGRNKAARKAIQAELFNQPATDPPLDPGDWQDAVRSCEQRIAEALEKHQGQLFKLVSAMPDASSELRKVIKAIGNLQTRAEQGPLSEHLALHIASSLMGADDNSPRPIDFIQISADIDCPADPTRLEVSDKVTGVQLGHFGAFYKESWRANDWMWGRIDGAMQLIGMLLQPDQVRARFTTAKEAAEALAVAARVPEWTATAINEDPGAPPTSTDPDDVTRWNIWQGQWAAGVRSELDDFYTKGDTTLKATVRALAIIAQLEIAKAELPDIVSAVERSHDNGGALPPRTRSFVTQYRKQSGDTFRLTLDQTQVLLPACNVARERIKDEVGSDLLTSTAATTAGIAVTALSGERAGAGVIGPLVKTVRTAVLTVYLVAQNAVRRTRTAFALTQLLLAFGGATIALDVLGGDVPSAVLVLAYVAITGWVVVTALSVGAVATLLPLLAAVVLLGAALMGGDRAADLFGDGERAPFDWKDTQARWAWIVPAGIGAVMAVFYKLRTRSLLRRLTLPEVRARLEKIWRAQRKSPGNDETAKAFTDLVSREVHSQRRLVNRSRRATWLSLIIGGALALAARPVYRWIFLHDGGHERWVSVCREFEQHRVLAVVLTIAVTLIALSLIRLAKLSVLGGRAGSLPRWRPRRWFSKKRRDLAAKWSEGRTAEKPSSRLARWLGLGVLPGEDAQIWYGRLVARAAPPEITRDKLRKDPGGFMVRLSPIKDGSTETESEGDSEPEASTTTKPKPETMTLQQWLDRESPDPRRVLSLHVGATGALVPRWNLPLSQRNTRFLRALRKVPIVKSWSWVKWEQIPTGAVSQD